MSKFTKEMVDDFADKLLIGLSEEENELVLKEFDIIEADINRIAKIPGIENVEPMTHALDDFTFTLREDKPEESLTIDEILQNAGDTEDGEIKIPKVVG